jgi:hypothetical protein
VALGKDVSFSKLTSHGLAQFVKNRDQKWSWEYLGGNVEALAKLLNSDLQNGLDGNDLAKRREQYVVIVSNSSVKLRCQ